MKRSVIHSLLALASIGLLSAQQPADRFAATRSKIESLLNQRLKATDLPESPANPFQFIPPGSATLAPVDQTPNQPESDLLTTDDQILAFSVSRLRVTGLVLRNNLFHVLINANTYKEGDLIPVRGPGEAVYYIRLMRISERDVTFRYNDTSVSVPLPR